MQTKADSDRTEYFTCISGFDCQHHGSVPWIVSTEALKLGRCSQTKFSHFLRLCRSFVSLGNICISVLTIGAANLVWPARTQRFPPRGRLSLVDELAMMKFGTTCDVAL